MNKREKPKRKRIGYSSEQLMCLEGSFAAVQYLTRVRRIELARKLGLTERNVKIWFQNKRMRVKNSNRESGQVRSNGGNLMSSMGGRAALPVTTTATGIFGGGGQAVGNGRSPQVSARSNFSILPPSGAGQLLHHQFNEHLFSYAPTYTMPCIYYSLGTIFTAMTIAATSLYTARPPARQWTEAGPSRATSPRVLDLSQNGPNFHHDKTLKRM